MRVRVKLEVVMDIPYIEEGRSIPYAAACDRDPLTALSAEHVARNEASRYFREMEGTSIPRGNEHVNIRTVHIESAEVY